MITKKHLLAIIMDTNSNVEWLTRKVERLEKELEAAKPKKIIEVAAENKKAEAVTVKKRGRGRPRKEI